MKAKHFEINVGFAQIRTGIWGAKDWVSNKAQYIMKNKARNAIPSNGTNEISGTTCYGIIRNEEVFSHNVKDEKSRSAMHGAPTFLLSFTLEYPRASRG